MASEWVPLNSVEEGDEDANLDFPWYPYLFTEGCGFSLSVSFATEEECRSFIEEAVIGAVLGER